MKLSEMISKLNAMYNVVGDVEVTITDGWDVRYYRGNSEVDFEIIQAVDVDGKTIVDIGVGGCRE